MNPCVTHTHTHKTCTHSQLNAFLSLSLLRKCTASFKHLMLYQLCQIFHCEIEDVVANAGILTLPNIFPSLASSTGFYIFRFYHIFFLDLPLWRRSLWNDHFLSCTSTKMMDQRFRIVDIQPRSATTKWILNATWASEGGGHLTLGMSWSVLSILTAYFHSKCISVGIWVTPNDFCCFFQWQMSSCDHVSVSPTSLQKGSTWKWLLLMLHTTQLEMRWLTCVHVLLSPSPLRSWMLVETWWWRWLERT